MEKIACVCTDVIADTSNSLLISYKIIFKRTARHQQNFFQKQLYSPKFEIWRFCKSANFYKFLLKKLIPSLFSYFCNYFQLPDMVWSWSVLVEKWNYLMTSSTRLLVLDVVWKSVLVSKLYTSKEITVIASSVHHFVKGFHWSKFRNYTICEVDISLNGGCITIPPLWRKKACMKCMHALFHALLPKYTSKLAKSSVALLLNNC